MMRLPDIEARLSSMQELQQLVGALRSLASMRAQEAQHALAGARRYGTALRDATRQALLLAGAHAAPPRQRAAGQLATIICTSEQGFVGAFNDRVLDAAGLGQGSPGGEQPAAGGERPAAAGALFILGSRGAARARERGHAPLWSEPMATRLAGVPEVVRRLAAELYPAIALGTVTRAEVVFARYAPDGTAAAQRQRLFPLQLPAAADTPRLPLHNLPAAALLEQLTGQYVFALLTAAAIESLASENTARLTAMESARDNVTRKLAQLRQRAAEARQEQITTELLDLVAGELGTRDT
jgi:F-type H+-transporting ATPase subunit gamma